MAEENADSSLWDAGLNFNSISEIAAFPTQYVHLCIYMFKVSHKNGNKIKDRKPMHIAVWPETFCQLIGN